MPIAYAGLWPKGSARARTTGGRTRSTSRSRQKQEHSAPICCRSRRSSTRSMVIWLGGLRLATALPMQTATRWAVGAGSTTWTTTSTTVPTFTRALRTSSITAACSARIWGSRRSRARSPPATASSRLDSPPARSSRSDTRWPSPSTLGPDSVFKRVVLSAESSYNDNTKFMYLIGHTEPSWTTGVGRIDYVAGQQLTASPWTAANRAQTFAATISDAQSLHDDRPVQQLRRHDHRRTSTSRSARCSCSATTAYESGNASS